MLITEHHWSCLRELNILAERIGTKLFLVGGAVRDLLRGQSLSDSDLDILVEGDALRFAPQVASMFGGHLKVFPKFYTAKLIAPTLYQSIAEIDLASSRTEIYESPGALPTVRLSPLLDDLSRRDFSINSIALSLEFFTGHRQTTEVSSLTLSDYLIDPFNGRDDLNKRSIRTLHRGSFTDDPTRLFRALRYKARIAGDLELVTKEDFDRAVTSGATNTISLKRRFNELIKILSEERASLVLENAINSQLFAQIFSPFQIDGLLYGKQLIEILSRNYCASPLQIGSAERVLLLTLIEYWPVSEVDPVLQALAISKKLRLELRSELRVAHVESDRNRVSREACAVVGASDKS